ncbi:MAG TPA: class I SAM-dependent methyltransferase [Gaiellaceae bacterium]|nr:class I SAM-dependent methyltransferase [Gaiellaceae bacterium]
MIEAARRRFARLATRLVVARPGLWRVVRRPLTRVFDAIAPSWDDLRVTPQHLAPLDAALAALPGAPARALDLGTGTGGGARLIAARFPEASVVGADFSAAMIREARTRATGDRERYEVADATALPYEDGAFDLVAQLNMIPVFDEVARVTAPGGHVAMAFSRGPQTPIWVPLERIQAELERRGFTHVANFSAGAGLALLARRDPPA